MPSFDNAMFGSNEMSRVNERLDIVYRIFWFLERKDFFKHGNHILILNLNLVLLKPNLSHLENSVALDQMAS